MNQYSRDNDVNRKNLQRWTTQINEIQECNLQREKKKLPGGGRKSATVDREIILVRWILERARDGIALNNNSVLAIAQHLLPSLKNRSMSALVSWLKKFNGRHNITYRRLSHVGQQDPFQLRTVQCVFGELVSRILKDLMVPPFFVYNMDQTGVIFDSIGHRVLQKKGTKKVWSYSREKSQKGYRCSVFLTVAQDGDVTQPFIVFPGTKNGRIHTQEVPDLDSNASYTVQKNGWTDTETMMEYAEDVFIPNVRQKQQTTGYKGPVFLLLDAHICHSDREFVGLLRKENVYVINIPPGSTSVCQPLDVSVMKPFKQKLRSHFVDIRTQDTWEYFLNCGRKLYSQMTDGDVDVENMSNEDIGCILDSMSSFHYGHVPAAEKRAEISSGVIQSWENLKETHVFKDCFKNAKFEKSDVVLHTCHLLADDYYNRWKASVLQDITSNADINRQEAILLGIVDDRLLKNGSRPFRANPRCGKVSCDEEKIESKKRKHPTCKVEGCEKWPQDAGMCRGHFLQLGNNNSILVREKMKHETDKCTRNANSDDKDTTAKKQRRMDKCKVEGCKKWKQKQGLCRTHYKSNMHNKRPHEKPTTPIHVHELFDDFIESQLQRSDLLLNDTENESVEAMDVLLEDKAQSFTISTFNNIPITKRDWARLEDKQWLNEELINFMGALLQESLGITFVSTFFCSSQPNVAIKFLPKAPGSTNILIIPYNEAQLHWSLFVVIASKRTVLHLDSMKKSSGLPSICSHLRKVLVKIFNTSPNDWSFMPAIVPQQRNGNDCGLYTLLFSMFVMKKWKMKEIDDAFVSAFRRRMKYSILQKDLSFL